MGPNEPVFSARCFAVGRCRSIISKRPNRRPPINAPAKSGMTASGRPASRPATGGWWHSARCRCRPPCQVRSSGSLCRAGTPYVVEVNRLGEARAVTEAEAGYRPTDSQIAWHPAKFIENVRGVSLDPVLMRRDWLSAYDFTTTRGSQFLGDYARAADPFARIGERIASILVTSFVRASDRCSR